MCCLTTVNVCTPLSADVSKLYTVFRTVGDFVLSLVALSVIFLLIQLLLSCILFSNLVPAIDPRLSLALWKYVMQHGALN